MASTQIRELPTGLVYAAYFAAFVFVVIPLADLVVISWPPAPGRVEWRVGVVGTVGQILTFPSLALAFAAVLAGAAGHRRVLRVVAVAALLAGLLALASIGLFALDAIQARSTLVPEIQGTFTRQILKSTLNLTLYGLLDVWVAVAGLRAAATAARRERETEGRAAGVVSTSKRSLGSMTLSASADA